jgi:hypothetical protein
MTSNAWSFKQTRWRRELLCCIVLQCIFAVCTASGQENKSVSVPQISLKEITGNPGSGLMIPLYFTAGPMPIREFSIDIKFVSNHLKFVKIVEGVLPEGVTADIQGKVIDDAADTTGVIRSNLRISISLTGKPPKSGLPDGLLAFLMFEVTRDAKPFVIKLVPTLVSASDMNIPPGQIAKINMVAGTVTVEILEITPEATCFFFSH